MSGQDRISQLPEPILQDILLLLPWEDAAHMCVLSKRFKDLWEMFPVFDFNFDQKLLKVDSIPAHKRTLIYLKGSKDLINVVDEALLDIRSKKAIIKKFRVFMYVIHPNDASSIDSWIKLVTKNCLRELDFEISYKIDDNSWYCLPPITYAAKTMEVLRLCGCKLEKPFFASSGKFRSLTVVSFVEVCLDDIGTFFEGCPLLEDFTLEHCKVGSGILVIPNLPKLRRLAVHHFKTFYAINILAVNLESYQYRGHYMVIHECDVILYYLKELHLNCVGIHDEFVEEFISIAPSLQNLEISCWSEITNLVISLCLLEELFLSLGKDLLALEIDTPFLRSFELEIHLDHTLPELFAINAPCLQESYLSFLYATNLGDHHIDALWFLRLRGYLSKFNHHNVIVFDSSGTITFNPDESDHVVAPPVLGVKKLKLENVRLESNFEALLDGLLWSCHRDILEVPYASRRDYNFITFLCEKLIDRREDHACCIDCGVKCWRHYIKDARAQGLMTIEDRNAFLSSFQSTEHLEVCFELKWE